MSSSSSEMVLHRGGCHCGEVEYEVLAPSHLHVYNCNCSICTKKQNRHFIVPKSRFKLLKGAEYLTTYTFNSHLAKHMFCRICGVQSFYQPRSNPDGYGIMPHCLDPSTVTGMTVEDFNGVAWEESMEKEASKQSSSSILAWSKLPQDQP